MPKKKPKVYNDGICWIVKEITAPSSFAAPTNGSKFSDFTPIYTLAFQDLSVREQDLTFAEAAGRTLTRKIKTHLVQGVNARHKVIVNRKTLYDIVNFDVDRANGEIYFYLEEVRELV